MPPTAASVPLKLDQPAQEAQKATPHKRPPPAKPQSHIKTSAPSSEHWTSTVRRHLGQLDKRGLFYPREAIARGEEGDVLVLMVLDEAGKVRAARIEGSSGHPLLDRAALNAVQSLSSLPDNAPRELVLPVRFRLR